MTVACQCLNQPWSLQHDGAVGWEYGVVDAQGSDAFRSDRLNIMVQRLWILLCPPIALHTCLSQDLQKTGMISTHRYYYY